VIACHCNSVCDRTVLSAVASGATTIDALSDICGAGARCGGCHDQLDTLVAAARAVDQAFGGSTAFGELPEAGSSDLREAALG
jgi:bacterioferritin-associated ferredoxin